MYPDPKDNFKGLLLPETNEEVHELLKNNNDIQEYFTEYDCINPFLDYDNYIPFNDKVDDIAAIHLKGCCEIIENKFNVNYDKIKILYGHRKIEWDHLTDNKQKILLENKKLKFVPTKPVYKLSFHFYIKGVLVQYNNDLKNFVIDMNENNDYKFDVQVYKSKGHFRCVNAIKEDGSVLLPLSKYNLLSEFTAHMYDSNNDKSFDLSINNKKNDKFYNPEIDTKYSYSDEISFDKLSIILDNLSEKTADEYRTWANIIYTIINISLINKFPKEDVFNLIHSFSKKSTNNYDFEKTNEEIRCAENYKGERKFTLGTLYKYLEKDNYEMFIDLNKKNKKEIDQILEDLFKLGPNHYDIARLFKLHAENFVNTCESHMYHFEEKSGKYDVIERKFKFPTLSNLFADVIMKPINKFFKMKIKNTDDKKTLKKINSTWIKIENACKTRNFKEAAIKEFLDMIIDKEAEIQFDRNRFLVGFKNGIYDLENDVFRPGQKNEYVSKTMGCNYDPNADTSMFENFIDDIVGDPEVAKYRKKQWGSILEGENLDQIVQFITGHGSNGKSLENKILNKILGDYSIVLPSSYFTNKDTDANKASPMTIALHNKRYASVIEMESEAMIQSTTFKGWSGNDPITARQLYSRDELLINLMCKGCLIANELPLKWSDFTYAVTRRIIKMLYPNTYKNIYDDDFNPKIHKPLDKILEQKLVSNLPGGVNLMIKYYKILQEEGWKQPEIVKKWTKDYFLKIDKFVSYISERLIKDDNAQIDYDEAFEDFKQFSDQFSYTRNKFTSHLEKHEIIWDYKDSYKRDRIIFGYKFNESSENTYKFQSNCEEDPLDI